MQGSPAKFVLNRNTVWTRTKTAKDEVRGSGGEEEGRECVRVRWRERVCERQSEGRRKNVSGSTDVDTGFMCAHKTSLSHTSQLAVVVLKFSR